jgi:hypothetical protein
MTAGKMMMIEQAVFNMSATKQRAKRKEMMLKIKNTNNMRKVEFYAFSICIIENELKNFGGF